MKNNFKVDENSGFRATLIYFLDKNEILDSEKDESNQLDLVKRISFESGVNMEVWDIDKFDITGNIWTVNGKFGTGNNQRFEEAVNGQIKIKINYIRIAPDNRDEFKESLLSDIRSLSRRTKVRKFKVNGKYLLLVDISDHHLGRLSWGAETGDSYDIKIATERFISAVSYFYDEVQYVSKKHPIEKIIFVVGNDYFNYDYPKPYPQTSNGTHQESDIRYQKMFSIGTGLVVGQIEKMSELAPVEIYIIPGNHDEFLSFHLGEVLNARFWNNENINVFNSPKKRKYLTYGNTLLGFGHHQFESFEKMYANMSLEEPKLWANSVYKYFYTGHKHHKETMIKLIQNEQIIINKEVKFPKTPILISEDLNGVLFDRLSSLTSNDYYESTRGFIHIKGAESFLFSKEFGKVMTFNHNLPISIHK